MYNAMKNLINKNYYEVAAEAQNKVDVFFACNRITREQYLELTALIKEKYNIIIEE